ncbi:MAG: prolipoprotein diacylglyceryl transferase [Eubacteriales bacterium]|nr:prolipoprotein diacylglyceryl transferase [Eubacteriales bacterium]
MSQTLMIFAAKTFHVSFPGLGINDIPVSRVLFTIGQFEIYYYSLCIMCGLLLALFLAARASKRYAISEDAVYETCIYAIPLLLIGARLYYVLFALDEFRDNWLQIFNLRSGGLGFYGGVLGGMLAVFIVSKRYHYSYIRLLDLFAPYLALGQAIGRWGNFFNQEAFGTNTKLPWGMISEGTRAYLQSLGKSEFNPNLPVHPTFFYEFLGNLLIFAIIISFRNRYQREDSKPGLETAIYLLLYGALRFVVEGLRTDSLYIGASPIRVSQLLSLLMICLAIIYFVARYNKAKAATTSENE